MFMSIDLKTRLQWSKSIVLIPGASQENVIRKKMPRHKSLGIFLVFYTVNSVAIHMLIQLLVTFSCFLSINRNHRHNIQSPFSIPTKSYLYLSYNTIFTMVFERSFLSHLSRALTFPLTHHTKTEHP